MQLPDSLTYLTLDSKGVREAVAQTYSFWGSTRTLEEHTRRNVDALARLGTNLRYVGLRNYHGDLVASLKFLTVALQTPQGIAKTLGIAAVFVPETHRGKGYGQAIVRAAIREAQAQDYDAALLYSDIAPEFYARLGFIELPALNWSAAVSSLPTLAQPLATRPANDGDKSSLQAWYHEDAAPARIFPLRTPLLWDYFRWWCGAENDLVLLDGGVEVGYLNLRREPQGMRLFEWGAPGVDHTRIWATIRHLAGAAGKTSVYGWLRPDHRTDWMTVTSRADAIPMIMPLKNDLTITPDTPAFFGAIDHF